MRSQSRRRKSHDEHFTNSIPAPDGDRSIWKPSNKRIYKRRASHEPPVAGSDTVIYSITAEECGVIRMTDKGMTAKEGLEIMKIVRDGLKAGIEADEKYKWHDLRKDPEDLPEDGKLVICQHMPGLYKEKDSLIYLHHFRNGRFVENWYMDTDFKSPTFGERYMGDVIAWRYIEPFEPLKEET